MDGCERTPSHHRMGRPRSRTGGTRHAARFLRVAIIEWLDFSQTLNPLGMPEAFGPALNLLDAETPSRPKKNARRKPKFPSCWLNATAYSPDCVAVRRIGNRRASCRGELVRAAIRGGARALSRRL